MQRVRLLLLVAWLPLFAGTSEGRALAPVPLVVVVALDSPLRDVSSADLRKLFMRNSSTLGGREALPLNQAPGSPDRMQFDEQVLGMRKAEVGRYWVDRKVRGESDPPHTIQAVALLRRVVGKLRGAVAYMRLSDVDGTIRVLLVDGKDAKHPSYPLR